MEMQPTSRRGRGRPRKHTTDAVVQDTAFRLFLNHGYDETSVDDIAAALGIGRSTFFRHFSSKSSVLWRDYVESSRVLEEVLAAVPRDAPPFPAVREAIVTAVRFEDRDRELLTLRYRLIASTPTLFRENAAVTATWAGVIARFLEERIGESQPAAPEAIAFAFMGATSAATRLWISTPESTFAQLLRPALELVAGALREALDES